MNGLAAWLQEFVAVGILASVGGAWLLSDDDLAWQLSQTIAVNTEESFEDAKVVLFNDIDREPDDTIVARYSATVVALIDPDGDGVLHPDPAGGIQVEHTWASRANWAHDDDHFERESLVGADLHNLFAVRQGINGSRGNHPFGELPPTARELRVDPDGSLAAPGAGVASGSFRDRNAANVVVFEPREDHKGDVARAMFYMSTRYWMPIPDDMEADLRDWHTADPVTDADRARNDRIELAPGQANRNPFIDSPELVDEIANF